MLQIIFLKRQITLPHVKGAETNNNSVPLGLERIKDTSKSLPSFVNLIADGEELSGNLKANQK